MVSELDIKQKDRLGSGLYHDVFPFQKFQDKVIKTPRGEVTFNRDGSYDLHKDKFNTAEMQLFAKHPNLFTKVYVIKPNYAVLERLNTADFVNECQRVSQKLFDLEQRTGLISKVLGHSVNDPSDIDAVTFTSRLVYLKHDSPKVIQVLKRITSGTIWTKIYDFVNKARASLNRIVDFHDGNLGYNKQGELRLLDV